MRLMRNLPILAVAFALACAPGAGAQQLTMGSKAPELKIHKQVQGDPIKFGDGKLHVIEMFATW